MALVSSNQYGATYEFGINDTSAPVITGIKVRSAELKFQPEVNETATDGEGHADSRTVTKPDRREINGTFTGYCDPDWDPSTVPASFSFLNRFYVVGNIGKPRQKGKYTEVSVEAVSNYLITGPAA
jgi:hypothetical protein